MSLLLDALRRAGNRTEPAADARAGEATSGRLAESAGTHTAQAVFRSTEGRRRLLRRRHAVILLLAVVVASGVAGAGWAYWQQLQRDFARDLAPYRAGPEDDPPADDTIAIEPVPIVADASREMEPDPAAERVVAEWEATVAAVEAAESPTPEPTEEAASPDTEATAAESEAGAPAEPDPDPTTAAAAEPEPVSESGPEASAERDVESPDGTAAAPRQAVPMVRRSDGPSPLEQLLRDGYEALASGDLRAANRAYGQALERSPDNRDALLGAAAVAHQRGDLATARSHYARILADDPRDPHAMSGLLSIEGVSDPRRSESEIKLLLRDHPDSHALHFALGNLYAAEARWGEAQSAYFEAWRGDAGNPNYAFNLAVALDHLGQRQAARDHYERALELAETRGSAFAPASARRRIEELR